MASADNTSTLDIDKALDVASRRMGYERLFLKQREAVEAFVHTLGAEPTLLHDPMAHTQVQHTAGWSHIQLPLTC